jgi:hypothetical protein
MSIKGPRQKEAIEVAITGTVLGNEGRELKKGLWETGVYFGTDGFVYQIKAEQTRAGLRATIAGKRSTGEYLRWVDGLFRPGELPAESNGVHYRAARKLRELL